jgi:6-pyruvoyltetrahydropterin/6-carboxytetrahydropterin synthase
MTFEYAHRFWKHTGEARYLHGHHGELLIEVEDSVDERGFVKPVKDLQQLVWEVMQNFDHALLLQEGDPLLEAILGVYEKEGIKNGDKDNTQRGPAFKCSLAWASPESRLVVTKKITTCENMVEIFHELLKDKLNIKRLRFQSNARNLIAAKQEY